MRIYRSIILLLLVTFSHLGSATENLFQTRSLFDLSYQFTDRLKFAVNPEFRFEDNFSLQSYLVDVDAVYKVIEPLSVGAQYRLFIDQSQDAGDKLSNRVGFSATYKRTFGHFEPSFRLFLTNDGDDLLSSEFLRYKLSTNYMIDDSKFSPFAEAELFHDVNDAKASRFRYSVGVGYKLSQSNSLVFDYKLDDYLERHLHRHILSLNYKIKL